MSLSHDEEIPVSSETSSNRTPAALNADRKADHRRVRSSICPSHHGPEKLPQVALPRMSRPDGPELIMSHYIFFLGAWTQALGSTGLTKSRAWEYAWWSEFHAWEYAWWYESQKILHVRLRIVICDTYNNANRCVRCDSCGVAAVRGGELHSRGAATAFCAHELRVCGERDEDSA